MRKTIQFWISLVAFLTCAQNSLAQDPPRFPLPAKSDLRVEDEIKRSTAIDKYKATEEFVKSIVPRYKAMKDGAPPHPLSCDGSNQDALTEERWKFDTRSALFGKPIGSPLMLTQKFLGCMEQTQTVDIPNPPLVCFPVPGTPYEICPDPPPGFPNCCANHADILEQGTLPWTVRVGLVLQRNFVALAMLSPFFSNGCNLKPPEKYPNLGYHLKFWWPENDVEVQNYERTVFNPLYECGNGNPPQSFKHKDLTDFLRKLLASLTVFAPPGVPNATMMKSADEVGASKLRFDPDIGESHWAGIMPGDQTFVAESHVYRTYNDVLTSLNFPGDGVELGYKRDCSCFYTAMQDQKIDGRQRKTVNGWTEQDKYVPYWRYWQNSKYISERRYDALYKYQSYEPDSCAFLRAWDEWGGGSPIGGPRMAGLAGYGYRDLYKALGKWPPPAQDPIRLRKELLRICYRGGGDLFPITGQLIGHFSPLPSAAYLARRALFLFGTKELKLEGRVIDPEFIPRERRINRYSDKIDKMQRVYPLKGGGYGDASECFRPQEIPNYLQDGTENWPRDLIKDALTIEPGGPLDTPRFIHWNQRGTCMCPYLGHVSGVRNKMTGKFIACTPNGPSCRKRGDDNGDFEDSDTAPVEGFGGHSPIPSDPRVASEVHFALGDGIPFPFMPEFGTGAYVTNPVKVTDPAQWQIMGGTKGGSTLRRGQCQLSKKRDGLHEQLPEDIEEIKGNVNKGGVQCGTQESRCPGGATRVVGGGGGSSGGGATGGTGSTDSDSQVCRQLFNESQLCQAELSRIARFTDEEAQRYFDDAPRSPGAPGTLYVSSIKNPEDADAEPIATYLCSYSVPQGTGRQRCPELGLEGDLPPPVVP